MTRLFIQGKQFLVRDRVDDLRERLAYAQWAEEVLIADDPTHDPPGLRIEVQMQDGTVFGFQYSSELNIRVLP